MLRGIALLVWNDQSESISVAENESGVVLYGCFSVDVLAVRKDSGIPVGCYCDFLVALVLKGAVFGLDAKARDLNSLILT